MARRAREQEEYQGPGAGRRPRRRSGNEGSREHSHSENKDGELMHHGRLHRLEMTDRSGSLGRASRLRPRDDDRTATGWT